MADPALVPLYDGPVLVRISIPGIDLGNGAGNLANFGYTEDGVSPLFNGTFNDVHGDQNGGLAGVPIDIQWYGEIAVVRLVFTKFAVGVAYKVMQRTASGAGLTQGTPDTPGRLLFTESQAMRLLLSPTSRPMNFTRAVPRGPISPDPKGVKYQRWTCEFECHKDANGSVWDVTTSG